MVGLSLCLCYAFLRDSDWKSTSEFHTIVEAIATLLALTVGAMALVRFYAKKNNTFLFIGTGFLGTAFLDGYHTIVTSKFFMTHMPSEMPSLIPWSWVASRQFLSILLFLSWLAWLHERRLGDEGRISERTVYLFTAFFTLTSFLFFAFVPLPRAYYPELVFHRPEEFLPALFFLLALVGYLQKGEWRTSAFEYWLVLSLIVSFVGQAVFMSFSGALFDFEFDAAHALKKTSYVCVLTGLMISMFEIFKQAAIDNAALKKEVVERSRAEKALREQITMFANAERIAQFGSWDWNVKTGEVKRSEELYRHLGVDPRNSPLNHEDFLKAVHPDDRDRIIVGEYNSLRLHKPWDIEFRIVKPNGEVRVIHEEAEVVLDKAGKPIRMVGIAQDITERKQAEDQLRHAQKMQAIGQLTGGVAHDFNNLLAVILGNLEFLEEEVGKTGPQAEHLQRAMKAVHRGAHLTEHLLSFSRRKSLRPIVVDLANLVSELSNMLRRTLGEIFELELVIGEDSKHHGPG